MAKIKNGHDAARAAWRSCYKLRYFRDDEIELEARAQPGRGGVESPTVRTVTAGDEAAAIDTIVLAFAADPVARWTWPQSHQYLAGMPRLVCAFAGNSFAHSGACCTEQLTGAALWLGLSEASPPLVDRKVSTPR
jgi:hypothetical protein